MISRFLAIGVGGGKFRVSGPAEGLFLVESRRFNNHMSRTRDVGQDTGKTQKQQPP